MHLFFFIIWQLQTKVEHSLNVVSIKGVPKKTAISGVKLFFNPFGLAHP